MRYIYYCYENGYCGCEDEGVSAYKDDTTDEQIEQDLSLGLAEYGSMYEDVAEGYDYDTGWEDAESEEEYYQNLSFEWRDITEEEYRDFGGN